MPDLTSIKPALDRLQIIERELLTLLIERDEVVRVSLVALLGRRRSEGTLATTCVATRGPLGQRG